MSIGSRLTPHLPLTFWHECSSFFVFILGTALLALLAILWPVVSHNGTRLKARSIDKVDIQGIAKRFELPFT